MSYQYTGKKKRDVENLDNKSFEKQLWQNDRKNGAKLYAPAILADKNIAGATNFFLKTWH